MQCRKTINKQIHKRRNFWKPFKPSAVYGGIAICRSQFLLGTTFKTPFEVSPAWLTFTQFIFLDTSAANAKCHSWTETSRLRQATLHHGDQCLVTPLLVGPAFFRAYMKKLLTALVLYRIKKFLTGYIIQQQVLHEPRLCVSTLCHCPFFTFCMDMLYSHARWCPSYSGDVTFVNFFFVSALSGACVFRDAVVTHPLFLVGKQTNKQT